MYKLHRVIYCRRNSSTTRQIYGLSRGLIFGAKEGDEEVKCTNTTLHSTNCIKSCTAEGILPRRDNLFGLSKGLILLTERKGRGSKARKYIRCNVGSCSAPSPTSPETRHNMGDSAENSSPRPPCSTARRQSGRHNPSVVRTTPPLEAKPKKTHEGPRWDDELLGRGINQCFSVQ